MDETTLRRELTNLLTVRQAHMDFEDAMAEFPPEHVNTRPPNCAYTFWHLVEHLRLAQRDIIEYILADDYAWPTFPNDYWPSSDAICDWAEWLQSVDAFLSDRAALVALVNDPAIDLFAPLPNSAEQRHTLLREIHVVAAHNAYHTGELGILRQVMQLWPAQS